MLEQLFNLIQNESEQEIIQNPAIPNEHNSHAVGLATDSIFSGFQNALSSGGLKDVLGMFGGKSSPDSSNPLVGGMVNNLVKNLMTKFGIDNTMAVSIASSLIPNVLNKLISKTNDPSDNGFDINGIIGSLTGNSPQQGGGVNLPGLQENQSGGIDFGNILKNITSGGLDADRDGSIGLDDIASMVGRAAGGAQQQNQQGNEGGIMDILKGFMR
ncbi:MAG: hypothetical protein ACOYLG_06240 [Chitinophagaceae bacterium]|jgi:hypothetical protein